MQRQARLTLQLIVQQEQGLFIGLGGSNDGEHPLAAVVVRSLGDADLGPGKTSDLGDLGSSTSAEATIDLTRSASKRDDSHKSHLTHMMQPTMSLGIEMLWVLKLGSASPPNEAWPAGGQRGRRQTSTLGPPPVTSELRSGSAHPPLSTSKCGSGTGPPDSTSRSGDGSSTETSSENALITGSTGLVVDGPLSPVPVTQQALSDLVDGLLDGLDVALDLDNSLGRLGQHLLGSDHSGTRGVLDLLDGSAGLSDDGSHEVVRDQQTHRGEGVAGEVFGVGKRGFQEGLGDLGKGLKFVNVVKSARLQLLARVHGSGFFDPPWRHSRPDR